MDMIAADDSASQVSDKIKDILYAKSSERVDGYKHESKRKKIKTR